MSTISSTDPSAVSWASVFAGAVGATALTLVLLLLGTGVGLSVVSPWGNDGASAQAIGWSTIIWITVVQALASVLGGYLAGRLRTRWITVHSNEVFFRDTAHGFLAWAMGTLFMATLLSSAIASSVSAGLKTGGAIAATAAPVAAAAMPSNASTSPTQYFADMLMRAAPPVAAQPATPAANATPSRSTPVATTSTGIDSAEVGRVLSHGIADGQLSQDDTQYLAQVVAARTGLPQSEAEQRVTQTFAQLKTSVSEASAKAKAAADEARKASAYAALWMVVSLLIGAFLAALAATFGGRLRDSSILDRT